MSLILCVAVMVLPFLMVCMMVEGGGSGEIRRRSNPLEEGHFGGSEVYDVLRHVDFASDWKVVTLFDNDMSQGSPCIFGKLYAEREYMDLEKRVEFALGKPISLKAALDNPSLWVEDTGIVTRSRSPGRGVVAMYRIKNELWEIKEQELPIGRPSIATEDEPSEHGFVDTKDMKTHDLTAWPEPARNFISVPPESDIDNFDDAMRWLREQALEHGVNNPLLAALLPSWSHNMNDLGIYYKVPVLIQSPQDWADIVAAYAAKAEAEIKEMVEDCGEDDMEAVTDTFFSLTPRLLAVDGDEYTVPRWKGKLPE